MRGSTGVSTRRYPYHESRGVRGAWCIPFAPTENPAGGFVAHEFSSIFGASFAKVDRFPAIERFAAHRRVVAGARAADPAVVLRIRKGDAGADPAAGRLARKTIGNTLIPDAARSGHGAI